MRSVLASTGMSSPPAPNTVNPFASTIDYTDYAPFAARARLIPYQPQADWREELALVGRILRVARREKLLLLNCTSDKLHPDLLAAGLIGFWPRRLRPVVVLMGAMWEPDRGLAGAIERLIMRLADRAIHRYLVQSRGELTLFPQLWHVSPAKMHFCPYFYTLTPREVADPPPPPADYVFAGGNSHRDYDALIEAARRMPDRRFVIATSRLQNHTNLPPNVTAKPVPHPEFVRLMRASAVVVVPIERNMRRAAGQQTYLNAMWLGKPTVVNDTLGVRDHVEDGRTARVVEGSPTSYVHALQWVFDASRRDEVRRLCETARTVVGEQYTFENHAACVLRVLDEAAASSGTGI